MSEAFVDAPSTRSPSNVTDQLARALAEARRYASDHGHAVVTIEHLLLALLDTEALAPLAAAVDRSKLTTELHRRLDRVFDVPGGVSGPPVDDPELVELLKRAAALPEADIRGLLRLLVASDVSAALLLRRYGLASPPIARPPRPTTHQPAPAPQAEVELSDDEDAPPEEGPESGLDGFDLEAELEGSNGEHALDEALPGAVVDTPVPAAPARGREARSEPLATSRPQPSGGGPLPWEALPEPDLPAPSPPRESSATVEGQLAHAIPPRMTVARPVVVEARLAPGARLDLAEGLGSTAQVVPVIVSRAMSVRLVAPDGGFAIESAAPETQWVDAADQSEQIAAWRWTVTPLERGSRRLQLVLSARSVDRQGVAADRTLPDQLVTVQVGVNYPRSAVRIGAWAIATVVGGALGRWGHDLVSAVQDLLGG